MCIFSREWANFFVLFGISQSFLATMVYPALGAGVFRGRFSTLVRFLSEPAAFFNLYLKYVATAHIWVQNTGVHGR
jgi:hypothetical protein